MYAGFVATLVPTFVPFKLFWAYFTGVAMIAAGTAFIVNRAGKLAAQLLGSMLCIFILLIHAPALVGNPFTVAALTRPLQDVALACACFFLTTIFSPPVAGSMFDRIVKISRYALGAMVIGFGIQ